MKVITIANQSKAVMRGKVAEDFKRRQALLTETAAIDGGRRREVGQFGIASGAERGEREDA